MSSAEAALTAAHRGAVFPLRPNSKRPAFPDHKEADCDSTDARCRSGHTGWEPRATTDEDRIRRAWSRTPYNIGLACGPSGLVVIDLDMPKAAEGKVMPEEWAELPGIVTGADVLAQICEWAGCDWPSTFTVHTPSGGDQLYFRTPEGSTFRNTQDVIGPMIDTRASGGYVVAAGSVIGGRAYEVTDDQEPTELPRWLARYLTPPEPEPRRAPAAVRADAGKRLQALVKLVREAQPRQRTGQLVYATFKLKEMIADGQATEADGEQLVSAAIAAGIRNSSGRPDDGRYARQQVRSVLGKAS